MSPSSSDDEGETLAQSATNYHFVDDKDEPISFAILPVQWPTEEKPHPTTKEVFLIGTADDGIQKIYKQVTAWKFDLSDDQHPKLSVLSKDKNNWIKLLKPRKSFEETVRTVLVTVHCLHFVNKNPEAVGKSVWDRLGKTFSSYEVRPCENDLLDHLSLIRIAIKQDETLSKSKFLATFLENPAKRKTVDEDAHSGLDAQKSSFIVDDEEAFGQITGAAENDDSDEETELFDSVCAICDNGGELLCCEGRCIRSFHPTVDAGEESDCKSLGLSKFQVKAMQNFLCLNCKHQRHQCFACGKLGSSDKSGATEVFHCVSATCGYFYHPECVAKLLLPVDEAGAEELQKRISAGESFTCPAHKCHICKQGENKDIPDLQFAVCRRCPRAYHRKCLPRKIAFDDIEEEDIITRAWDSLLPNNRVLIYCLKHKMDEDLGTPIRNHIIFPRFEEKKKLRLLDPLPRKRKAGVESRALDTEDTPINKKVLKVSKYGSPSDIKRSGSIIKREKPYLEKELDSLEKHRISDASRKSVRDGMRYDKSAAVDKSAVSSRGDSSEPFKSKGKEVTRSKFEGTPKNAPPQKKQTTFIMDAEAKKRIIALMEKQNSSITLEEVVKKHKIPSTHGYSSKGVIDKTITLGKVEGFVEAVRTALKKLEEGGSVEDAKAVCGPEIVNQILKWKNKLKVYLAPFLHGMRYTSFGRHFTKVDKLKEIVDKLHWYTQDGDMIVDFCCGANDFSWLMKQRLEETGKRCSFKNFDVIQPKNDFSFEKRDWMTVRPNELPNGSNLIMGLNPPFGVKAALANKFIDKALQFQPKLLILIVPPETERLDRKRPAYDLVWEDNEQLSGKSFYLPGSVDVNDNQMDQWNLTPPPLYLWSRSDMTSKHKTIARKHGHLSDKLKVSKVEEKFNEGQHSEDMERSPIRDYHREFNREKNLPVKNNEAASDEIMAVGSMNHKKNSPSKHDTGFDQISKSDDSSRKEQIYKRKKSHEKLQGQEKEQQSKRIAEIRVDPRSLAGDQASKALDIHADRIGSEEGVYNTQSPGSHVSSLEYRSGYGGISTNSSETLEARRHGSEGTSLATGPSNWSTSTGRGREFGGLGMDVQFPGYISDSVGNFGRTAYTRDRDESRRDDDVEQLLRRYSGPNPAHVSSSSQLAGQDAGFGRGGSLSSTPYHLPGSIPESSYGRANSSAMQRYAPRLDELNHTPMSGLAPQRPLMGSGTFEYALGPTPRTYPNMSGFAPGPRHPSSHHGSAGWLNE